MWGEEREERREGKERRRGERVGSVGRGKGREKRGKGKGKGKRAVYESLATQDTRFFYFISYHRTCHAASHDIVHRNAIMFCVNFTFANLWVLMAS